MGVVRYGIRANQARTHSHAGKGGRGHAGKAGAGAWEEELALGSNQPKATADASTPTTNPSARGVENDHDDELLV